jgi:glycosyltransferase involved in cell wall biosynthesis
MRTLVAIPVFNEEKHVRQVLSRVLGHNPHVLVIDDGSTDQTPRILPDFPVDMIRHATNSGYGKSLRDAFRFAIAEKYDWLITMDCDEQHEPAAIPGFIEAAQSGDADIISGSRYLLPTEGQDRPPPERRAINATMTAELNCRLSGALGTLLTDAFCGFKAYRVSALKKLRPSVRGYAFPMQFWVQSAAAGLKVRELPVRLIYNDLNRTFGARLDDPAVRLGHYRRVLHREIERLADRLPRTALTGVTEMHAAECCMDEARHEPARRSESTRHECGAEPRNAAAKPKSGCCRR